MSCQVCTYLCSTPQVNPVCRKLGMSTALRSTFGEIHYEDDALCQSLSDSRRGDASQ